MGIVLIHKRTDNCIIKSRMIIHNNLLKKTKLIKTIFQDKNNLIFLIKLKI